VRAVTFSPGGKLLAAAGDSKVIALYDVFSGEQVANLTGHGAWVFSLDWSDTGEFLLSGSESQFFLLTTNPNLCVEPSMGKPRFGQLTSGHASQRTRKRRRLFGVSSGYRRRGRTKALLQRGQIVASLSTGKLLAAEDGECAVSGSSPFSCSRIWPQSVLHEPWC